MSDLDARAESREIFEKAMRDLNTLKDILAARRLDSERLDFLERCSPDLAHVHFGFTLTMGETLRDAIDHARWRGGARVFDAVLTTPLTDAEKEQLWNVMKGDVT